ncbi:uncharacterized protein LOC127877545 isoform X1 [Dreissena polymorpha]|nr:uncharacterized protein LOC127877545 isoform X1 [Dreissena polymorpha]XP_052279463.1 uncharacterized protein LOC127877545 isoform X1 [Dreissena polymorpha]
MGAKKTKLGPVKEQETDLNKGVIETKHFDQMEEVHSDANNSSKVTPLGKDFMDARGKMFPSPVQGEVGIDRMEENGRGKDTQSTRTTNVSLFAHDVPSETMNSGNQISSVETITNGNGHEDAIKAFKENKCSDSAQHSPIQRTARTDAFMQTSEKTNLGNKQKCNVQTEPTTNKITRILIGSNRDIVDEDKKSEDKHTEHKPVAEHETPKIKEAAATRKKKKTIDAKKTKLGPDKEQETHSNIGVIKTTHFDKKEEVPRIGDAHNSSKVTLFGRDFTDAKSRKFLSPVPAHDVPSETVNSGNQISSVETVTNGNDHEDAIKAFKENKCSDSAQYSPIQRTARTDAFMQTSEKNNLGCDNKQNCNVQTEPSTNKITRILIGSNGDIDEDKKSEDKHIEHKPVNEQETPPKQEKAEERRKKKKKNPLKRESEKRKLKVKVSELQQKLITHEKEIEDLKTRLSRVLGDRLTDNNHNIADLSDMNRPTKIAERFSELYDNQWTNVFETLTAGNKMGEKEAIRFLLETIKTIYNTCRKKSIDGYDRLQSAASEFAGVDLEELSRGYAHWLKLFKDSRKHNYLKFLYLLEVTIQTEFEGSVHTSIINSKDFKEYSTLATELCWLMCIQDPPVVMVTDCHHGELFDKNLFRMYKRNGVSYSYLVWPALLLHTGGGILMKGVAQPKKGMNALFNLTKHDTKVQPAK